MRVSNGQDLLRAHHSCVYESLEEHDEDDDGIHHADSFWIGVSEVFSPKPFPLFIISQKKGDKDQPKKHRNVCANLDHVVFERIPG